MSTGGPTCADDLVVAALKILNQPDPWTKAAWTREVVAMWRAGEIALPEHAKSSNVAPAPDRPARADDQVRLVSSGQMPKLGKGGNLSSRTAIVHSLCHIESWAVDLSWDVIARWGQQEAWAAHLPRDFYDDFVNVADDECRHFIMLESRLKAMGSYYGALVAHDGLWESACMTSHSLAARLAVEHCVHEARGLDVLPATVEKFRKNGDEETAVLLEGTIYPEEISHCAAGVRWLRHLHTVAHTTTSPSDHPTEPTHDTDMPQPVVSCQPDDNTSHSHEGREEHWMAQARRFSTVQDWFHYLVRQHFRGALKPPFNTSARAQAGFDESWYMPLCNATSSLPNSSSANTAEASPAVPAP